jgi:predicted transcriptional regulator
VYAVFLGQKIEYVFYLNRNRPIHVSEDCSPNEVFALLDDEYARAILTATSTQPMSAKTLSEECDASLPTVYRRADRLVKCGLLAERTEVVEDGHHYSVYEAQLDRLTVDLDDGELHVDIEETTADDVADRFTDMWEDI